MVLQFLVGFSVEINLITDYIKIHFSVFFYSWVLIEISLAIGILVAWFRLMGILLKKYRIQSFNPLNAVKFFKEFPQILKEYPGIRAFLIIASSIFFTLIFAMIPFGLTFGKR